MQEDPVVGDRQTVGQTDLGVSYSASPEAAAATTEAVAAEAVAASETASASVQNTVSS